MDSPDDDGVTETHAGAFDAGKRDRERLAQGSLLERHVVGQLVQPCGGVRVEARERAVVRRRGEEDDAGAWVESGMGQKAR